VAGSFSSDGSLTVTITNIPGGVLSKTVFTGKFDLVKKTFAGTYKVYSMGVLFATGDIEAHVHLAPSLKVPGTVNFTGTSKTIQATATSNVGIKSFKAQISRSQAPIPIKSRSRISPRPRPT
jgi:hypothetical protein